MRAADVADDIVVATTNWMRDGGLKHPRKDSFVDFDHGTTLISSGENKYTAEVVVGITNEGEAVFYDVIRMEPTSFEIKKVEPSNTATTQNAIGDMFEDSTKDSLAQKVPPVNTSISENTESDTVGEQKYSVSKDGQAAENTGWSVSGEDVRWVFPLPEDMQRLGVAEEQDSQRFWEFPLPEDTQGKTVAEQSRPIYVRFSCANKNSTAYCSFRKNTTYYMRAMCECRIENKRMEVASTDLQIIYGNQNSTDADPVSFRKSPSCVIVSSNITSIAIFGSNSKPIPAGFFIQIYGVRA